MKIIENNKIKSKESLIGRYVRCPKCESVFEIEKNDIDNIGNYNDGINEYFALDCPVCDANCLISKE